MVRRLTLSVVLVIGLLAIAASGLIVFRTTLAEAVLSSQLASLGIPSARLTVASLDFYRIVVRDVALGAGEELRLDAVTVTYRPRALLAGRLEEAAVDGLRLRLDLSGAGPPLGSLQPLLQKREGAAGAGLLPAVVTLLRGRIEVVARAGDMTAAVSGQWRPLAGTATLTLSDLVLPHVALETSRLDIEATRTRIVATAAARGEQDALGLALNVTLDSYRGDPTLTLALDGSVRPADWKIPPVPPIAAGRMAASLRLEGRLQPIRLMPLDAAALDWLLGADLRGRLQTSLDDIAYRNGAEGISGTVDLAVSAADGALNLEIADDAEIRISRLGPALLDAFRIPALAPQLADAALTVALPMTDAPFRVRLRPTEDGAELAVSGTAGLAAAETGLQAYVDGTLALDKAFALQRLSFPRADLRLHDLAMAGHRIEELHFTGAMDGAPEALRGGGELTANFGATRFESLALGAAAIGLAADFRWSGPRLELHQRGDGSATVASLGLGEAARVAKPVALLLSEGALTLDVTSDGPALSHALTIRPEPATVDLRGPDGAPLALRADPGAMRLEGGADPGAPWRGRLDLDDGRLSVPAHALSAEAVAASIVFPTAAGEPLARVSVGRLLHTAAPAYFAPLRLDGEIVRQDDTLVFKGAGTGADGELAFSLGGQHRLADGRGSLRVQVPETAFRKGALQPAQLFPLLRDVSDATGRVGATADVAWGPDGLAGEGVLDMAGLSFMAGAVSVEGLSSRIALDGLFPPSTGPGQAMTIRRVDPALPLDDVEIRFRVEPAAPPRLRVERARARFADGWLGVDEVVLDPSRPRQEFGVGVDGMDLGLLLGLLKVEGVSGTGRLTGTVPVAIEDGGVSIENGQLAADGPGILRVRSEAAAAAFGRAGEQVTLMLSALEDFHYDVLAVTLDMDANGDAVTLIRMQGRNPAVLDGYPFAFNIGLSGNLMDLFAAIRRGAGLSTDLVRPQLR